MTPFAPLRSLLLALQGGDDPRHIAAGFALGAALGLVPKGSMLAPLILVLLFFFRVDKAMAAAAAFLFLPVGYLWDPLAHALGLALLTSGALKPLWTALYDLPIIPLTRFNNTVVLGNIVIGAILYLPLYLGFLKAVHAYRAKYKARVDQWPIVKFVKGFGWYESYQKWLGS